MSESNDNTTEKSCVVSILALTFYLDSFYDWCMTNSIVRTDRWQLNPTPEQHEFLEATVNEYRAFCKALSYVVMGHWTEIALAASRCAAVEKLIHKTSSNPNPKYQYFQKRFYKFPSYLRRAEARVCFGAGFFIPNSLLRLAVR